MNGGYAMFNGGGLNIAQTGHYTLSGAFNRALDCIHTGKPIVVHNFKIGTIPASPVCVQAFFDDTNDTINMSFGDFMATITTNDTVNVTVSE